MPRRSNPCHWHLTYKKGLQPVSRQPEFFAALTPAQEIMKDVAARLREHGCRVKIYSAVNPGIRAYDCEDENWSDRSYELHGCHEWPCDGPLLAEVSWTTADRRQYLQVLKERGLVP